MNKRKTPVIKNKKAVKKPTVTRANKRPKKPVVLDGIFSTDLIPVGKSRDQILLEAEERTFLQSPPRPHTPEGVAMDKAPAVWQQNQFTLGDTNSPELLVSWYSSQGFIGANICALISQHWLVDKACTMPAKDAIRNGYDIMSNDGTELKPEVIDEIRQYDKKFQVKKNLIQFSRMSRIFGIRILMFKIKVDNPVDFYRKPFNIDGVPPKSYLGMSQIDPYWITPLLDAEASGDPSSMYFYEPTWWVVNGMQIHRTHLIITKTNEVPDILKPTYVYGGVPLPQKVYERIYAAERTANEAPMLSLTKRTGVLTIDTAQAVAKPGLIQKKLAQWAFLRDNYAVYALGLGEKYDQKDITLADLDAVIMTQYQIVAAIAEVPAVKLLGTSPKGFGASGEYESESYHESLQSIQSDEMEPVLDRHHQLLIKSWIAPNAPFVVNIKWRPLDVPTSEQKALLNKTRAETAAILAEIGAIDGRDERERLSADADSDYHGMGTQLPLFEETEEDDEPELQQSLRNAKSGNSGETEESGGGI